VDKEIPWAATLFYASDGFTLYYLSDPITRHSENIVENPLVAVTVDEDPGDWQKIKGIQLEGKAELVSTAEEVTRATKTYVAKYPFTAPYLKLIMSPFPKAVAYLEKVIRKLPFLEGIPATSARFYKVTPTKIRFIDNKKDFGHPEELVL
jgi:uncharacterized protein YhbP (UPF0306 family)